VTPSLLDALDPQNIVISVKAGSARELPEESVSDMLESSGKPVYTTADSGAVMLTLSHDGAVDIETMK